MNLNSTADIMTAVQYVNANMADRVRPDVFYSKQLLDTIRMDQDQYVYYRYAESSPIEEKAGKLVLRRWTPLQAHTNPLEEGVPPKSDKGTVQKYEMTAYQYGRYMEFTDKVDFTMIDPVIANYTKEYSIVAIETLDLLARDALMSYSSKYYAGGNITGHADLVGKTLDAVGSGLRPTLDDLRKVVLTMKRNWIKPRQNGKYHVICSPEFTFDMVDDPRVEKYMTINQSTGTLYDGAVLCPMFGMEFYETSACLQTGKYTDAEGNTKYLMYDDSGTISAQAPVSYTGYVYDGVTAKGPVANGFTLGTAMPTSYVENIDRLDTITDQTELKLQHIFVLGDKALYRTGLSGEDAAKMYVKPLGSSGVLDPIDQRQSIGFKINSVGFAVIDSRAVFDYICLPATIA